MVDALLAHMKSIGEFLQHTNNMAPDVKEKIAQNQLDQLLHKLSLINVLTAEQATTLSANFEGSCFSDSHRATWVEAVSSKIAAGNRSSGRKPNQVLLHFGAYLTPSEVQLLQGDGNVAIKLEDKPVRTDDRPCDCFRKAAWDRLHTNGILRPGARVQKALEKTSGKVHLLSRCTCSTTPGTPCSCPRKF